MKRIVLAVTLLSLAFGGARPAAAGDWNYAGNYGYPAQPVQNGHPVLKKVLIGGALVGIGFLAGRLTAPKPNYGYGNYPPAGPQFQPSYNGPNYYGPQPGPRIRF